MVRNETTKLVTDLVDFDRVQSLLLMISHRRRYLAMKEARLHAAQQDGECQQLLLAIPTNIGLVRSPCYCS